MWMFLLQGIVYGFAAASQPGPFQAYIISQALTHGWRKTLSAALAPLISDAPIIALCLLVLSQVPPWMQRGLYIAGGLFVLYLSFGAYQSWRGFDLNAQTQTANAQGVLKAALMNALSPGPYLFWTLVTGPILLEGWRVSPLHGAGFLFGFYLTLISGLTAIILVFGLAAKLGAKVNRAMLGISALALFLFGWYQLWRGIVP